MSGSKETADVPTNATSAGPRFFELKSILSSVVVSVYVFWEAARLGAPLPLLVRMASNIAVDLLGGYVPGVGDVFDAFFKANRRNVELLRGHFGAREELGAPLPAVLPERALAKPTNPITRYAVGVGLTLALLVIASGPIALLYWLMSGG